ncbi:hypothetical protein CRYUN_Cryun09bG0221600 [Craigia yunnanensis]
MARLGTSATQIVMAMFVVALFYVSGIMAQDIAPSLTIDTRAGFTLLVSDVLDTQNSMPGRRDSCWRDARWIYLDTRCIYRNIFEKLEDAEIGLSEVLHSEKPVRITNKNFIDHIFTRSLEVALRFDLPLQIHTGCT